MSNKVEVVGDLRLANRFRRQVETAKARAGRKIGAAIVREARVRAKMVSPKGRALQKRISYKISGRRKALVILSLAPQSEAMEGGATIVPRETSSLTLFSQLAWQGAQHKRIDLKSLFARKQAFIIKTAAGNLVIMRRGSDISAKRARNFNIAEPKTDAIPIATLVKRAVIKSRNFGFGKIVESKAQAYRDEIEANIARSAV